MKEQFEWIQSWCDNAEKNDLPRVLLVGDSITNGYAPIVREKLGGVCYVDHLATSYAIDTSIYNELVEKFVSDSDYSLVHINHGLHGKHMPVNLYEEKLSELIGKIQKRCKVVAATTTCVNEEGNKKRDESWMIRVEERNAAVLKIAEKSALAVDDLFSVSVDMPLSLRFEDGTHYIKDGYARFAEKVAKVIKEQL